MEINYDRNVLFLFLQQPFSLHSKEEGIEREGTLAFFL